MTDRERPSRHGALLGAALADIADAGFAAVGGSPDDGDMCATCAFRRGCMTNQMAGTLIEAFKIITRQDPDRFACHHGMKAERRPTKLCGGYLAAMLAPFDAVRERVEKLSAELAAATGPDEIRAAFDAWIDQVDPDGVMDDYQRGRAYLRHSVNSPTD